MASTPHHTQKDVEALQYTFVDIFGCLRVQVDLLITAAPTPVDRKAICAAILGLIDTLVSHLNRMRREFPAGLWNFEDLNDPIEWLPPIQKLPRTSGTSSVNVRLRDLSALMALVDQPVGTSLDSEEDDESDEDTGVCDANKVVASEPVESSVMEVETACDTATPALPAPADEFDAIIVDSESPEQSTVQPSSPTITIPKREKEVAAVLFAKPVRSASDYFFGVCCLVFRSANVV